MDQRSLEKNLKNIERELVNLQTAHEVGIGAVIFYQYGEYDETHYIPTSEVGRAVWILLEAAPGENINFMFQSYTNMIGLETIKSSVIPNRYAIYIYYTTDWGNGFTWDLVSSSRLLWHYAATWEEAEEWMGQHL